jgi:hypothetical protein
MILIESDENARLREAAANLWKENARLQRRIKRIESLTFWGRLMFVITGRD